MDVQYKIDCAKVLAAFERAPNKANKRTVAALRDSGNLIIELARTRQGFTHTFIPRTGKLDREGPEMEVDVDNLYAVVFLNEARVEYARYIHEGTRNKDGSVRIEARPYLYEAGQKAEADIQLIFNRAMNDLTQTFWEGA